MRKILESVFKNRLDIDFIGHKKLQKIIYDVDYQIVEFKCNGSWKKEHIVLSTIFTPVDFKNSFQNRLNKNKTIVIYGEWRKFVHYYRILKFNDYKVYLYKSMGK